MAIIVYNKTNEDYSTLPNNYYIGRGSVLGNPYTHKQLNKTMALFHVSSRDEAVDKYDSYFDLQYGRNEAFTELIDEIYEKYKNGEDIYLECYCKPQRCHGDVIASKLQKRLLKEKIREEQAKRNAK